MKHVDLIAQTVVPRRGGGGSGGSGSADDIFGKIEITGGPSSLYNQPVGESVASLFIFGVLLAFFIGGLIVLFYLLWGALDYITSGGEPENTEKARGKMVNAIIGMILLVVALTIWIVIMTMTGVITAGDGGFRMSIPTLGN